MHDDTGRTPVLEEVAAGLHQTLRGTHSELLTAIDMVYESNPVLALRMAERVGEAFRQLLAHILMAHPTFGQLTLPERPSPRATPARAVVEDLCGEWILEPLIKLCLHRLTGLAVTLTTRELQALRDFGRSAEDEAGRNIAFEANLLLTFRREELEAKHGGADGG